MLRLLMLLLLLANAGYFAWSHGTLAPYGFAPAVQSEPQRLTQQLRPEALRILTPLEASRLESPSGPASGAEQPRAATGSDLAALSSSTASTLTLPALVSTATGNPAPAATQCLQAGLFSEAQTAALRARLQNALPTGSWAFESSIEPARWMIYMGKYANADAVARKRSELRQRNVSFQPLNNPALEPGLSLGNFSVELDAETELERIARRGVKTARIIQAQAELRGQKLKLAAVTPDLRAQLEALKPQLLGKTLQPCR